MMEYRYQSCIRGFHVYQQVWSPAVGEIVSCERETTNRHDPFAVMVVKSRTTVGHLPRKISCTCSMFLRKGGLISCEVTGKRQYSRDLVQGGLEVPCTLIFEVVFDALVPLLAKVKKLILLVDSETSTTPPEPLTNLSNPSKKQKIESEIENSEVTSIADDEEQWLFANGVKLHVLKRIIEKGEHLNDNMINFAQNMLKLQFPDTDGLFSTLIPERFKLDTSKTIIQILHTQGNHWVVVSNINCEVGKAYVYDIVFSAIGEETKQLIDVMFDGAVDVSIYQNINKQIGSRDCGVFCIGIATYLLYNCCNVNIKFTQSLLRSHLITCFENLYLTPFP